MVIYQSEFLGLRDAYIPFMSALTNILGGKLQACESYKAKTSKNKYIWEWSAASGGNFASFIQSSTCNFFMIYPLTKILAPMAAIASSKQMTDVAMRESSCEVGLVKFECCPLGGSSAGVVLGSMVFDLSIV